MNLGGIAILNIHGSDYLYIINRITKSDAAGLLQNVKIKRK